MASNQRHDAAIAQLTGNQASDRQRSDANFADLKDFISRALTSQSPNQRDELSTLAQKQKKDKSIQIIDPPAHRESTAPKKRVCTKSAQLTIPGNSS